MPLLVRNEFHNNFRLGPLRIWLYGGLLSVLLLVFGLTSISSEASTDTTSSASSVFQRAQYHIETTAVQRIHATLTDHYDLPNLYAKEWTIYAPDAPETGDQKYVFSKMDVQGHQCKVTSWSELSPLNRTVLQAQMIDDGQRHGAELSTSVDYIATLYRRNLVPGPPTTPVEQISAAQRSEYTRDSVTIDYNDLGFQSWLDTNSLRRMPNERDLDFALRVFEFIRQTYTYDYDLDQDRRASMICQVRQTDCGGLSQLFVAVMRASGVPALALCGRLAKSAGPEDHGNCHVKSQFYAEGIGWVPVEMSGGTYDKSAPFWTYFGRTYGDFLTLSLDNDQQLSAGRYGVKNQRGLQGVRFWVWGANGSDDAVTSSSDWTVEQLPLTTVGRQLADARD